ncbi:hypothetical protein V8C86DRAFT_2612767 [Haematococcus lacustris]
MLATMLAGPWFNALPAMSATDVRLLAPLGATLAAELLAATETGDFHLIIDEQRLRCHRAFLCVASPSFRAILCPPWRNAAPNPPRQSEHNWAAEWLQLVRRYAIWACQQAGAQRVAIEVEGSAEHWVFILAQLYSNALPSHPGLPDSLEQLAALLPLLHRYTFTALLAKCSAHTCQLLPSKLCLALNCLTSTYTHTPRVEGPSSAPSSSAASPLSPATPPHHSVLTWMPLANRLQLEDVMEVCASFLAAACEAPSQRRALMRYLTTAPGQAWMVQVGQGGCNRLLISLIQALNAEQQAITSAATHSSRVEGAQAETVHAMPGPTQPPAHPTSGSNVGSAENSDSGSGSGSSSLAATARPALPHSLHVRGPSSGQPPPVLGQQSQPATESTHRGSACPPSRVQRVRPQESALNSSAELRASRDPLPLLMMALLLLLFLFLFLFLSLLLVQDTAGYGLYDGRGASSHSRCGAWRDFCGAIGHRCRCDSWMRCGAWSYVCKVWRHSGHRCRCDTWIRWWP